MEYFGNLINGALKCKLSMYYSVENIFYCITMKDSINMHIYKVLQLGVDVWFSLLKRRHADIDAHKFPVNGRLADIDVHKVSLVKCSCIVALMTGC